MTEADSGIIAEADCTGRHIQIHNSSIDYNSHSETKVKAEMLIHRASSRKRIEETPDMQGSYRRNFAPDSMGTVELVPILSSPEVRRKSLPYLLGIPAFALLCVTLIWIAVSARLVTEKAAISDTAAKEISQLAESYAEQLERTVDGIDRHTRNLAFFWNYSKGALRLERRSTHHLDEPDDHPAIDGFAVGIANRSGRLVTSWPAQPSGTTIADKAHFIAHRIGHAGHTSIHYLDYVRITGRPAIVFSHALTQHGAFDGLVFDPHPELVPF